MDPCDSSPGFVGFLASTAHDFDPIRSEGTTAVKFEIDVFNEKSPDVVAEAVGIKVSLESR